VGSLTTHVLDTSAGRPARGLALALFRLEDGRRQQIIEAVTNEQGRCDAPLLEGRAFSAGVYELLFETGAYFRRQSAATDEIPPFLDKVPVRFGVSRPDEHYHVPLLVTPWSYSTYRGS